MIGMILMHIPGTTAEEGTLYQLDRGRRTERVRVVAYVKRLVGNIYDAR